MSVEQGFIVLADISGFDAYLSDVELEHAHGVVKELVEMLIEQMQPPMNFAAVQGDAVLAYAARETFSQGQGMLLVELADATYLAFRDRVERIHRNTTCQCRACLSIPTLDLKFLVHYGEYVVTQKAGGAELGGLDARLISERLIKNQAGEGDPAYVLFTRASADALGLSLQGARSNRASYDHYGEVATVQLDLSQRYERLKALRERVVGEDEADIVYTREFSAPPEELWDWLNNPLKRTRWMRYRTWQPGLRPRGQEGVGATNHCDHGLGTIEEVVLAWHPTEHYTVRFGHPRGMVFWALQSVWLEPLPDGGTRLKTLLHFERDTTGPVVLQMAKQSLKQVMPRDYAYMESLMRD